MVFTSIRACPSAISYTAASHDNRVANPFFGNIRRSLLGDCPHLLRTALHAFWNTRPPSHIDILSLTNSFQIPSGVS